MFDINKIEFKVNTSYSFVGLKRNANQLEFWLPHGFETFLKKKDFEKSKDFFFKMYRTFQVYNYQKRGTADDRDGVVELENGFRFQNKHQDEVIFYGKLKALDKILEGYDEFQMDSLEKKEKRSNQIDYSKIHRYMHQAIYLDDDVIYLDEMNIAKNVLMQTSPSIIQLFCFIYTEIKTELEALENLPNKAIELAEKFKQTYLQPNSHLFAADTFADTLHILKAVFDDIGHKTTYKDEDFWHFYEAIEVFLKGEEQYDNEGIYFGINQFYDVWEDMCQTVMTKNFENRILFADGRIDKFGKAGKIHPFKLKFNQTNRERWIKPDLVVLQLGVNSYTGDEIFNKVCITVTKTAYTPYGDYANQRVTLLIEDSEIEAILKKYLDKAFSNVRESDFGYFKNEVIKEVNANLELQKKLKLWEIKIIDYKYMKVADFNTYAPKLTIDIRKQLLYEWAIQQHDDFKDYKTESEFWIPFELDKTIEDVTDDITSEDFKKTGIKVKKINFNQIQSFYVKSSR